MPAAGVGQKNGPDLCHNNAQLRAAQPVLQRLSELASSAVFTWLLASQLPLQYLNNFLQGKRFHNQQEAENAFQEFVKSQSTDFYATGINKLVSHWQKCVDCNGSYYD